MQKLLKVFTYSHYSLLVKRNYSHTEAKVHNRQAKPSNLNRVYCAIQLYTKGVIELRDISLSMQTRN